MPLEPVTVVVPTRNRLATLRVALRSILAQTSVEVQVIVVDEGSTDGTPAHLATLDDRVTVIRNEVPKGLPTARNLGIDAAETRLVALCDDDDLWAPNKLESQLFALSATPGAGWSCTGNVSVDDALAIVGHHHPPPSGDIGEAIQVTNVVPAGGSSVVVDRDLVREV